MSVDALLRVIQPTTETVETPERHAWQGVEARIGTALPDDYKAFIERLGTGRIDDFLWVFNPFSDNTHLNLVEQIAPQLENLRVLEKEFNERLPYALFPDPGGLLPFASTDNGDVLFWRTVGTPNHWTVVVNEARAPEYEEFASNMTDFLFNILTRTTVCKTFPEDFPGDDPRFRSS